MTSLMNISYSEKKQMYLFLQIGIIICILRNIIVLVQLNRLHDVYLLNMTQYQNCTLIKSKYAQVHNQTQLQANFF